MFERLFNDPHHIRGDIQLVKSAVQARWDIPPEAKTLLLQNLLEILRKNNNARATLSAGRLLTTMESTNQADDHLTRKIENHITDEPNIHLSVSALSPEQQQMVEQLSAALFPPSLAARDTAAANSAGTVPTAPIESADPNKSQ